MLREEWLEKIMKSDGLYKFEISGAFSLLKTADFSRPTDAAAKAAIMVGDMESIKKLANAGYKRWCIFKVGWNAFRTPCVDVVKFIVEQGFDVDTLSATTSHKGQYSPLCLAAECGHADVVEYLLSAGADAKFTNKRGFTPLHFAASSYSLATVKLLVEANADINAVTRKDRRFGLRPSSVLDLMAEKGFYGGIKYLVECGAKLHHPKEYRTLLHAVCLTGNLGPYFRPYIGEIRKTTDFLLSAGFDPFDTSNYNSSPVARAANASNIEALRALVDHGVPLDKSPIVTENDKLLPLEIAAANPWTDEDLLLETLNFISEHSLPFSETYVLNCAIHSSNRPRIKVCRHLLDQGCPVNTIWKRIDLGGEAYFSPLHSITSSWNKKRAEIVSMLIESGADVNQEDPAGRTPLACVLEYAYVETDIDEVLSILHNAGADFNAKSKSGHTIMQIAQRHHAKDSTLELLKKFGAK